LNTQVVIDILLASGVEASRYGPDHIMVRHGNRIDTLVVGSWVVRGENGAIKCYSDEQFKVKYEAL
jgi:hypothetical protein